MIDSYPGPLIKDVERKQQNTDRETAYQIFGPRQERPSNMNAALKCTSFKKSIIDFLLKDWHNEKYSEIIANKKIYITSQHRCTSFEYVDGVFTAKEEYDLYSHQEEVDYRILGHLNDIPSPYSCGS